MSHHRRPFQRKYGERRYKKILLIATEGVKTEPQYFAIFNNKKTIIQVKCLKGNNDSSPPQVLRRMKEYLKKENINKNDEAWLVVDKDDWSEEQLVQLFDWSKTAKNYYFALSNPNFEFWLLLHYEDGKDINNPDQCLQQLNRYLPNYNKEIDIRNINNEMIEAAIKRAKLRDNPPIQDWPRACGQTTVYKLVENIFDANKLK